MASIFHQNMRMFGGMAGWRNTAYNGAFPPGGAFAAINGLIAGAAAPIAVAGFTEVTNNGAAPGALANSAVSLGLGGGAGGVVGCGRTALAAGWEYIGIYIQPGWALVTVGRMLLQAGGNRIGLAHQRAATFAGLAGLAAPAGMTPDYRGLAYVIVTVPGGPNIAIGFLHNLFTRQSERVLVAEQLPPMAAMMGQPANGQAAVGVAARYIGGDFNIRMVSPRGTRRQGPVYGYSLGLAVAPPGATAGGTTWSGNLYDYWYTDIDPGGAAPAAPLILAPVPNVFANTLNHGPGVVPAGSMSDHAGVSLRFT